MRVTAARETWRGAAGFLVALGLPTSAPVSGMTGPPPHIDTCPAGDRHPGRRRRCRRRGCTATPCNARSNHAFRRFQARFIDRTVSAARTAHAAAYRHPLTRKALDHATSASHGLARPLIDPGPGRGPCRRRAGRRLPEGWRARERGPAVLAPATAGSPAAYQRRSAGGRGASRHRPAERTAPEARSTEPPRGPLRFRRPGRPDELWVRRRSARLRLRLSRRTPVGLAKRER